MVKTDDDSDCQIGLQFKMMIKVVDSQNQAAIFESVMYVHDHRIGSQGSICRGVGRGWICDAVGARLTDGVDMQHL